MKEKILDFRLIKIDVLFFARQEYFRAIFFVFDYSENLELHLRVGN